MIELLEGGDCQPNSIVRNIEKPFSEANIDGRKIKCQLFNVLH